MEGRTVKSSEDCADCLCAVCARSAHTSMTNSQLSYLEKDCFPCDNCYIGDDLVEIEEDCPTNSFLPDDLD